MSGPTRVRLIHATRTIEEGVVAILWAATLPSNGPTGGFFQRWQTFGVLALRGFPREEGAGIASADRIPAIRRGTINSK